jgi:ABC-type glycerol-3-phosphate transport system substrate-binding protein
MNRLGFKPFDLLVVGILMALIMIGSDCSGRSTSQPDGSAPETISEDSEEAVGGEVVITFAATESQRGLYEPLMEAFHQQNPGITVQFVGIKELDADPLTLASAADATLLSKGVYPLDLSDSFRDLTPLMETDPDLQPDDFWPGLLSACQDTEGRTVGVSLSVNLRGIFFDPEAFDQVGLAYPVPGWTWDDFRTAVVALAEQDGEALRYGFADREQLYTSILAPLVDASLIETGGEIEPGDLAQALQWYFDLAQRQAIYPLREISAGLSDADPWQTLFSQPARPAMWSGSLGTAMPGGEQVGSATDAFAGSALAQQGLAPFPIAAGRPDQPATPAWVQCGLISAGSRHPQAAWDWLEFLSRQWLVADPGQARELAQAPARRPTAESAGFWKALSKGSEPVVRFGLEHAWYGTQYPQAFEAVNHALLAALAEEMDLASALEAARSRLTSLPETEVPPGQATVVVATPLPVQSASADAVVVDYFANLTSALEDETFKTLVEEFNRTQPEIFVRLSTIMSTKEPESLADAASQYDCFSWLNPHLSQEGVEDLLSLDALMAAEDSLFEQDFSPDQLDAYYLEGSLYGLPAASQPSLMMYNADLLARRSLQPPPEDWTFDEFLELAAGTASTSESDKSYGFVDFGDELLLAGRNLLLADLTASPPAVYFDQPETAAYLNWLVDMIRSGVFEFHDTQDSWKELRRAVTSGQVAFWASLAGYPYGYYFDPGDEPGFETGVVPMPSLTETKGVLTSSIERVQFISRQAKDPQACWMWIKFLSEQPNAFLGVPARKSVAASSAWEAGVGPDRAKVYRLALRQLKPGEKSVIRAPLYLGSPLWEWWSQTLTGLIKGERPEELLADAQLKADHYLACITAVDVSELDGEELQDKIDACAQQADPDWGR